MAPWVDVGAVLMVEARATQVRPAVHCALTAEMPQI